MFDILELLKNTVSSTNFKYNNEQLPWVQLMVKENVIIKWKDINLNYIHYL